MSKLEWDMCSIIAFDFVEHIIQRLSAHLSLPTSPELSMESVRSSSEALITMCSGHQDFSKTSPCLIASACVYATLKAAAGLTTNSIFLFPFWICLEGKSMIPRQGNIILFHSSQQLPRLRTDP